MALARSVVTLLLCANLGGCVLPPPPPPPVQPEGIVVPGTRVDALARLAAIPGVLPPGMAMVADGMEADGTLAVTRLVLGERVLFDSGSDQPLPGAPAVLALVAEAARQAGPRTAVTVLGHTDSVGGDAYNMDLSRRRATVVIATLERQGMDPAALTAVAVGRRQPVASNATAEGRAANRRVEFLLSPSLAANLAAVTAQAGDGTVGVLRPGPDALLHPAGTLRLGPGTMPAERGPASRAVQPVRPAQPMLRLNQPEAVRPAPLGPAITY